MIKYKRCLVKRTIAVLIVLCTMLSYISVCRAAKSSWQEYTLPIQYGETNNYLDIANKENSWFVEVQSLAKLANCQVQQKNGKIALSRGEVPVILYEVEPNICIITDEKTYLPLQEATTAVGMYFYEKSNTLGINILKVPKELSQKMEEVFANDQLLLSRMQKELGWIWDTAQTTARVYSILPFVGSYSFVGAITGENEIQQYKEGFGHILANDGTAFEMLQKFSDFDQLITDSATTLELAEQLTHQDGALKPYADKYGIDEQLMSTLGNEYPEEGYEAGVEEWLSAYTDVTTAINIKYILDACVLYSAAMDAEESMIAAMKSAFEFCGNYSAKVASERIIARRCGSEINSLEKFCEGWAFDTLSNFISKKLETVVTGDFKPTELATAAITRVIDFGLGASDKANAILFYDIYTSMQNELRRYYNQLCVDKGPDNIYEQRAATIMYLKCGISAYENMEFDDSIKNAVANAQNLFAGYLVDILAFSQQEYAPEYDNQIAIDWLNTNKETGRLSRPKYLVEYLGMTVNEIAEIFGEDYVIMDDWLNSGSKGICYEDYRSSANFYFHDPLMEGLKTGDERIHIIETAPSDWMVEEGVPTRSTYSDLENMGLDGEVFVGDPGFADWRFIYSYDADLFTTVTFYWNFGDDPATTYPALIDLYKKGLDVDVLEPKPTEGSTGAVDVPITMSSYGGIWQSDYVAINTPMVELVITDIGNDTITCNLYVYRLYNWENISGHFISDNTVEMDADIGNQYVKFLLTFGIDYITITVDETDSYYFEAGKQYVLGIRSDRKLL